jgi:hypothetical protein
VEGRTPATTHGLSCFPAPDIRALLSEPIVRVGVGACADAAAGASGGAVGTTVSGSSSTTRGGTASGGPDADLGASTPTIGGASTSASSIAGSVTGGSAAAAVDSGVGASPTDASPSAVSVSTADSDINVGALIREHVHLTRDLVTAKRRIGTCQHPKCPTRVLILLTLSRPSGSHRSTR